jgi:hypothetical protein
MGHDMNLEGVDDDEQADEHYQQAPVDFPVDLLGWSSSQEQHRRRAQRNQLQGQAREKEYDCGQRDGHALVLEPMCRFQITDFRLQIYIWLRGPRLPLGGAMSGLRGLAVPGAASVWRTRRRR